MQAVNDYILIEPVKKSGVLEISDTNSFIVQSIGSFSPIIKRGDVVVVDTQSLISVMVSGEEKYFIKEENILAVDNVEANDPSATE